MRFAWSGDFTRCRATALDATNGVIGEVTVDLPEATRSRIWSVRGASMQYRMEEAAERHLRTILELR